MSSPVKDNMVNQPARNKKAALKTEKMAGQSKIRQVKKGSDEGSENYWKDVAEERKEAVEATKLENTLLQERVSHIRKENDALAVAAEQKEYMETLAKTILDSMGNTDLQEEPGSHEAAN